MKPIGLLSSSGCMLNFYTHSRREQHTLVNGNKSWIEQASGSTQRSRNKLFSRGCGRSPFFCEYIHIPFEKMQVVNQTRGAHHYTWTLKCKECATSQYRFYSTSLHSNDYTVPQDLHTRYVIRVVLSALLVKQEWHAKTQPFLSWGNGFQKEQPVDSLDTVPQKKERTQHWNFSLNLDKNKMTRRTLDPEKLVKIHIYNNLLAYNSETCLSIFVPKRQRIFVPLSHFDVHSRSDGTHKIANIYGSRDALPIPLYIISAKSRHLALSS